MKSKLILGCLAGSLMLAGCSDEKKSKIIDYDIPKELSSLGLDKFSEKEKIVLLADNIYKTNLDYKNSESYLQKKNIISAPMTISMYVENLHIVYGKDLDRKSEKYKYFYNKAKNTYKYHRKSDYLDEKDYTDILKEYADLAYMSELLLKDYLKENNFNYNNSEYTSNSFYDVALYRYSNEDISKKDKQNIKKISNMSKKAFETKFNSLQTSKKSESDYDGDFIKDFREGLSNNYGNLFEILEKGNLAKNQTDTLDIKNINMQANTTSNKDKIFIKVFDKKEIKIADSEKLSKYLEDEKQNIFKKSIYQYLFLINYMDKKSEDIKISKDTYIDMIKETQNNKELFSDNLMENIEILTSTIPRKK